MFQCWSQSSRAAGHREMGNSSQRETLLLQLSRGKASVHTRAELPGASERCLHVAITFSYRHFFCRNRVLWLIFSLSPTNCSESCKEGTCRRVVHSLCVSLGKEDTGFEEQRGGNLSLWVSLLVPFPGPSLLICQWCVRETRI